MIGLLWQLFSTFFVIGLFNFGGGGAMLSLIQAEVVSNHEWISEAAFTDIVAISQSTPGPIGINCATYVGYEVAGILGSATATLAVVLPSFFVFFLIMKIFNKFRTSPAFNNTMKALRPATAGLIGAAAFILIFRSSWDGFCPKLEILSENFPDWRSWLLFIAAFVLSYRKKVGPIGLIVASAIIGLLIF